MRRLFGLLLGFLIFCSESCHSKEASPLPRTIVTLYDRKVYPDIWFTRMHQYAEMPLNHLGVKLVYHDIREGLPKIKENPDVIGALVWFPKYTVLPEPEKYLEWAIDLIDAGKKFVMLGTPGFYSDEHSESQQLIRDFWNRLGLEDQDDWVNDTYAVELVVNTREIMDFERKYTDVKPPYHKVKPLNENTLPHLTGRQYGDPSTDSVLVATSPTGGYIYEGYEKYEIFNEKEKFRQWYINPFIFFNQAYKLDAYPKPDTTTLSGRRIYYSHIDGDGWNSVTELEKYRRERAICARVVRKEFIDPYPDYPVTVGVIGADLDQDWVGSFQSQQAAEELFVLPQVEVASHTYSHPFNWHFFQNYQNENELPYLHKYPHGSWKGNPWWSKIKGLFFRNHVAIGKDIATATDAEKVFDPDFSGHDDAVDVLKDLSTEGYEIPRAYANQPFDLKLEVDGSLSRAKSVTNGKKPAVLYQWSGNCQPFEEAIRMTRERGVKNLNGGDTRFDSEFFSFAWVRPIGRQVGQEHQIYASNSNENTYTNLWRDRFYGFNQLPETVMNTETPLRLKPANLYYHMYSGEKLASVNAVKQNLDFFATQELIPITASRYSGIAEGFFQTGLIPSGKLQWKVRHRGDLQTIRFDRSALYSVDINQSQGVVGHRHFQGSLYVYLDENVDEPVIVLQPYDPLTEEAKVSAPYLVESRWRVWGLVRENSGGFRFMTEGFGRGEMSWKVSEDGVYEVKGSQPQRAQTVNGTLTLELERHLSGPQEVTVQRINDS